MIKLPPHRLARRRPNAGMALVICLALLVLITAAVMAFFARATENRVVESSRMHRVKTEQLGQSAADYVVGRFLQEVTDPANSTVKTVDGHAIYQPRAAANAIPQRSVATGVPLTDENYFNLIRQSVPSADTNATSVSSSAVAKNGRAIGAARWNAPFLLGGTGFGAVDQLPNWIYVNADGAVTTTVSTNVSGRFAYNVYNVGGLLDANIAGYPSTLNAADLAAIKSTLAGADLTQLGLSQATVDALVSFRNPEATSAAIYTNIVARSAADGFNFRDGANYHNNLFTTRQDLLRYAQSRNPDLTNALPYMGTFIRGSATPSYEPDPSRPKTTGSGSGMDDQFNPSMLTIRVKTPFTRMDGSTAKVGEPLVKRRFPLSRLAWIGPNGPAAGISVEQIRQAFGLEYDGDKWNYVHGNGGGAIMTLENVRDLATAREPDFFELLQAGMQLGSMCKSAGGNAIVQSRDTSLTNQILQIGANLIDQADENSLPTTVAFNGQEFYGIENLPYLYRVFMTPYRFHGASQPATQPLAGVWFQPEIWNPHAQAPTPAGDSPTEFRFMVTGQVRAAFGYMSVDAPEYPYPESYRYSALKTFPDPASAPSAGIKFGLSSAFSQPRPLLPGTGVSAGGDDVVTDDGATNFVGIHAGTANVPDRRKTSNATHLYYKYASVSYQTPVDFLLQYWNGSKWVTYNRVPSIQEQAFDGERPSGSLFMNFVPSSFYSLIDPRTNRFSMTIGYTYNGGGFPEYYGPDYNSGSTQRPNSGIGMQRHGGVASWSGWTIGGPQVVGALQGYFGELSDNLPSSSTRYVDWDGVLRPADGAYTSGSYLYGYPLATNNFESRPVVLNRPFRSVGEMGYASRDIPWKHLDFFTKESADGALLDLFCLEDTSDLLETAPNPVLEAGRVDLNTRHKKVLQALLVNTSKSEGTDRISAADAETLAGILVSRTTDSSKGPLINRSELATKWAQDLDYASAEDRIIKRRREAAVRALSDVGNTRTWNLLIDVVVQAGRPLPNSNSPFQVEGEQRCWVHVVIDRPSGKIISQFSELVYE